MGAKLQTGDAVARTSAEARAPDEAPARTAPEMIEGIDAHPLFATPSLLDPSARRFPGPNGVNRKSGALPLRTIDNLMALAEAVFSDGAPPPPDRMAWTRYEFADFMARGSPRGRLMIRAGGLVVAIVAPLMIGKLRPFRRLGLEDRVRALEKMEATQLASIIIALRAVLCIVYFEHPDAAAEVGLTDRRAEVA